MTTCHKKVSCVLKNVQNIFVNEMTSLIRLLVGFEYYLRARKTSTNGFVQNGKSALIDYSDTTDTNCSETLVPLRATC